MNHLIGTGSVSWDKPPVTYILSVLSYLSYPNVGTTRIDTPHGIAIDIEKIRDTISTLNC